MQGLSFKFHTTTAGMLALNKSLKIINADAQTIKFLGDNILGSYFLDYVEEYYRKVFKERIEKLINENEKEFSTVVKLKNFDSPVEIGGFMANDVILLRILNIGYIENAKKVFRIISTALGNLLEMILITDANGKIVYVNPAFTRVTGYSPEEVIGKTPTILSSGKHSDEFYENMCKTALSGKIWHGEIINKKKNGELYYEEMTIVPVKDENGNIEYLVALKYDITDRKIREEKLKRNNQILSTLHNISLEMGGFPDFETLYKKIYKELKKVLNFSWLLFGIYDENKDEIYMPYIKSDFEEIRDLHIKCDPNKSIAARVIKNKKPILIRDMLKELPPSSYTVIGSEEAEEEIERSAIFVPILYQSRSLGVLSISAPPPNVYSDEDVQYLSTIANSLAIFMENYNLYREIKEAKELYETLINTTLVGIVIIDPSFRLKFVNKTFADMVGYSPDELLGRSILEITTLEGENKLREEVKLRFMGISDSYETTFVKKNGEIIDVLIHGSPLRDASGDVIGSIGVIVDITERKNWERWIREEWEKYKIIMDNILVGIVIVNDGKVIFANKRIKELLGYEGKNVIGEDFLKFIHPEMRDYLWENYQKRLNGEPVPDSYPVKLVRGDGTSAWGMLRGAIVEWEGKKVDMISIQDITPLKEMEEKLIALVNAFEKIKLARSEEEVYKLAIDSLSSILNFNHVVIAQVSENGVVARKWIGMGFVDALDLSKGKGIVAWVAKNGKPYYAPDVSKDDLYLLVNPKTKSEYATPISVEGRIFGVLNIESEEIDGISNDDKMLIDLMASHIAVALAGLEYQKKLEKSKNLQELMLHIVSHDLKNPLTVLQGYVDLAREEPESQFFGSMNDAIAEATNIIDKARLFSKLGSEKIELEKKKVKLSKVLEDSIDLIRKKYPKGEIVNSLEDLEIDGFELLREAFVNILDNAFKYGATKVEISSNEINGYVEIRFADDGPGIPDENKKMIFDPFIRLSAGKGSGLGLSIVKMILELHGGDIRVEDNQPHGSVFVLKIPKNIKGS